MVGIIQKLTAWTARTGKRALMASALFALPVLLTSCYLPTDFDVLIQVTGDGRYVLAYKGQLTSVGMAKSLRSGKTTEKEPASMCGT